MFLSTCSWIDHLVSGPNLIYFLRSIITRFRYGLYLAYYINSQLHYTKGNISFFLNSICFYVSYFRSFSTCFLLGFSTFTHVTSTLSVFHIIFSLIVWLTIYSNLHSTYIFFLRYIYTLFILSYLYIIYWLLPSMFFYYIFIYHILYCIYKAIKGSFANTSLISIDFFSFCY